MEESEMEEIRQVAEAHRQSVSEWVRSALRQARQPASRSIGEKLRLIREASRAAAPVSDIEQMNREIQQGYLARVEG